MRDQKVIDRIASIYEKQGSDCWFTDDSKIFLGDEQEWLAQYAKRKLETKHYDYFIFGHRHLAMKIKLSNTSTYQNIGDWITQYTYGVFDGLEFSLQKFEATETN